jgi:acyl-CoA dehydrogenase
MTWDFSTEPEYQEKLDWARHFVDDECRPLDLAFPDPMNFTPPHPALRAVIVPLKQRVRDQGLWAMHLSREQGGPGVGQLKLALLNEILGRSRWAPVIFGTQAPDTGNAEILAHYGTDDQKATFLEPLMAGEIFSSYSMTEPHAGADPKRFTTRAVLDGAQWVISGEKYFSSNARTSAFLIVMAVTDPEASPYNRMSMFLVPTDTPGINFLRNIDTVGHPINDGPHGYIRYQDVRVPAQNLLGERGQGFVVAQTRLGGGRLHHAMRTVAVCKMALEMMCQRALSRETQGGRLSDKQMVQEAIADSWVEIEQFRFMVLHTAWLCDQSSSANVRREIAACKVQAAKLYHDVVYRSLHVHGALGVSNETPLADMWLRVPMMGIVDGPTEVHKVTIARDTLGEYDAYEGLFPPYWLPPLIDAAEDRYHDVLEAMRSDSIDDDLVER